MVGRDPDMLGRDPIVDRAGDGTSNGTAWIIGGLLAAVLVLGVIFYSMSGDGSRTAGTSPPATTGQTERVTPPANPNATTPQKDAPATPDQSTPPREAPRAK